MKKSICIALCFLLSVFFTSCDNRVLLKDTEAVSLYEDALSVLQNMDERAADYLLIIDGQAQKRVDGQVEHSRECSVSETAFLDTVSAIKKWSEQQDTSLQCEAWRVTGVGKVGVVDDDWNFCTYNDGTYYFCVTHSDIADGQEIHFYLYPTCQRIVNASSQHEVHW